ncbi:MAG: hypothetical protein WCF84_26385 [Anaerolineae bacterium]
MLNRIKADFTTLTLALIPVAIVINIVVGHVVQDILKLPIYLDSVGTVLVAVLAGPIAGAITGALSNILWGIIFSNPQIMPFAITAFFIGLVAGILAQMGWFKRDLGLPQGLGIVAAIGVVLIVIEVVNAPDPNTKLIGGGIALVLTLAALLLTALRVFPPLVAAGGLLTGMVAALISAPIAALVFNGVTGSGTDAIVAFLEASGANVMQAALGQGLTSDPFDKFVSFFVVWVILRGLARRYLARFPRAGNVVDPK